jgi:uncharacterized protein (TIGR02679 family)
MEIVKFFKSNLGFDRVLRAMYDMFLHHGRAFGAVRLTRPSEEEEDALSEFFNRDYYNQALIRIGLADFERQIHKNFSEVSLGIVLAEYMGKPTVERHQGNIQKSGTFASAILDETVKFAETPAELWLKEISAQTRRAYRFWAEMYLSSPEAALSLIRTVASALNDISPSAKASSLAAFSEKHTGSPTALDFTATHGKLFLKALACRFKQPAPVSLEDCISLHLRAGLLTCGMLSSVTVAGVLAKTDGQDDAACVHYGNLNQAFVLTLENISHFTSVSAIGGKVFVVEDPQVYASVLSQLGETKCTLINLAGGYSAAFMYLLKLLNVPTYYAGNMDYKGLELADKLFSECGNFIPWRYSREDYTRVLSENSTPLPDEKKNLAMHNETLASLLSFMKKTGKTAASMPLVPLYIDDIKNSGRSCNG